MNAKEIIDLLPSSLFDKFSVETSVDYKVKKLEGKTIFSLLLFSLLSEKDVSLRVLETISNPDVRSFVCGK